MDKECLTSMRRKQSYLDHTAGRNLQPLRPHEAARVREEDTHVMEK
jgi:hypothetical protein